MNKNLRRILFLILSAYAAGLLFFFAYSLFTLPVLKVGSLRADWVIGNSLVLFVRNLIPLQISTVLIAYSLFFNPLKFKTDAKNGTSLFGHAKQILILFLVLTTVYTVFLEGIAPYAGRLKEQSVKKTAVSKDLKQKADKAENEKRYSDARYYLEYYLAVNPADTASKERLEKVISLEKSSSRGNPSASSREPLPDFPPLRMSFDDVLDKAVTYFDNQDFISAEYFAGIAMRLDASRPEPRRIIAVSRDRLSGMQLSETDIQRRDLYRLKRDGWGMIERKEWAAAYYHFSTLQKEYPQDGEIKKYLKEAYEGLKTNAFFREEIALLSDLPVYSDLLFRNDENGEERDFLYFRSLVQSWGIMDEARAGSAGAGKPEDAAVSGLWGRILRIIGIGNSAPGPSNVLSYYAVDIEGIGLTKSGEVRYHFKAPFGKFIDKVLVMRCLTRTPPQKEFLPDYIIGEPGGALSSNIKVRFAPEDLQRFSRGMDGGDQEGLRALYSLGEKLPDFGADDTAFRQAFLMRLLLPFSFLVLSVFSAGIGWNYRGRYLSRPVFLSVFVILLLPFLASLVFDLYRYTLGSLTGLVLVKAGFAYALPFSLALQGLLLFSALLYLVRQFNK